MAERSQNLIAAAKVLIDRFRLGGRFHHYQIHDNPMIYWPFYISAAGLSASWPPGTWVMQPRLSNRYTPDSAWRNLRKGSRAAQIGGRKR
jgi:hypothetical protein